MFKNNKNQSKSRPRSSTRGSTESFRRNNTVISRTQREMLQRQQSVTQRQHDLKKKAASNHKKKQIIAIIAVALAVFAFQRMKISNVMIVSNASSRLDFKQDTIYVNSILSLYSKNTLADQYWLLDEHGFEQDIKKEFPEVKDIKFSSKVPFSQTFKADITFRKAVFTWQDASGRLQYVDSDGVLFDKSFDATVDTKKLGIIDDQSGTVLEPGSPVLTSSLVKFIGNIHGAIKPAFGGRQIAKIIIPKSTREVQVQIVDTPYIIKFSSQRTVEEQISELNVLQKYLKEKNINPVNYIDLRLEHKAFYK